MRLFIDDGYTITAGKRGSEKTYPFQITYRPYAGRDQLVEYNAAENSADPTDTFSQQMLGWPDKDGKPTKPPRLTGWGFDEPLTLANLKRLRHHEFSAIVLMVHGYLAPDYEIDANGQEVEPTLTRDREKNS